MSQERKGGFDKSPLGGILSNDKQARPKLRRVKNVETGYAKWGLRFVKAFWLVLGKREKKESRTQKGERSFSWKAASWDLNEPDWG